MRIKCSDINYLTIIYTKVCEGIIKKTNRYTDMHICFVKEQKKFKYLPYVSFLHLLHGKLTNMFIYVLFSLSQFLELQGHGK